MADAKITVLTYEGQPSFSVDNNKTALQINEIVKNAFGVQPGGAVHDWRKDPLEESEGSHVIDGLGNLSYHGPVTSGEVTIKVPIPPRKFSLIEIESEIINLANEVMTHYDLGTEPPEELVNTIVNGMDVALEKRDRVVRFFKFSENQCDMIDNEIKRLEQRKVVIERATQRFKDHIHRWMVMTGNSELKGNLHTLKIAKVQDSCDVVQADLIADEFKEQKPAPPPTVAKAKVMNRIKSLLKTEDYKQKLREFALRRPPEQTITNAEFLEFDRQYIAANIPGVKLINGKTRLSIK